VNGDVETEGLEESGLLQIAGGERDDRSSWQQISDISAKEW